MLDFIEAWWSSVQLLLKKEGITGRFERSPMDRLNPSCNLHLCRGELEVDLIVWDSGEAELATMGLSQSLEQQHFDDIRKQPELGIVLSRLTAFML